MTDDTLNRTCAICGKDLTIHVATDGTYEGGHYWPDLTDGGREYWECEECYAEVEREDTLSMEGENESVTNWAAKRLAVARRELEAAQENGDEWATGLWRGRLTLLHNIIERDTAPETTPVDNVDTGRRRVTLTEQDDERWEARDESTGVTRLGDTSRDALGNLEDDLARVAEHGWLTSPAEAEAKIVATRAIITADDGSFVTRDEFHDRLRKRGVEVEENFDDEKRPDNVARPADVRYGTEMPDDVSLAAAHLAIDTGRDPSAFISPHPNHDLDDLETIPADEAGDDRTTGTPPTPGDSDRQG